MSTQTRLLTGAGLDKLVDALREKNTRVIAPVSVENLTGGSTTDYRELREGERIALRGPLPRRSLKEFFLPPTEELLRWTQKKQEVILEPARTDHPSTVIIGAFPCDAAAVPTLDKVMDWDYHDDPWFGRRAATTIISRACPGEDASCFCTAMGLSPDTAKGADLLLVPLDETGEDHLVEILTDKGKALVEAHKSIFETPKGAGSSDELRAAAKKKIEENLSVDPAEIRAWLQDNFEHELWDEVAMRCHGCGACAAVCPTCHCFDIVDEPDGIDSGVRRRNWDTCQTSLFTLHGSGHNPRDSQPARIRQRVMHKLYIYPERFDEILCTGCGRCARACAGGMDLPEVLEKVSELLTPREAKAGIGTGGAR